MDTRVEGRNREIFHLHVHGWTQYALADKFGMSQQRISQIIREIRELIGPVDVDARRQAMLERLDASRRRMLELAEMNGAPVTAGKDGSVVYDPESGGVVRDYGLRINATRTVLAVDDREAKLLGLDAPAKADLTVHGEAEAAGALADEARRALNGEG